MKMYLDCDQQKRKSVSPAKLIIENIYTKCGVILTVQIHSGLSAVKPEFMAMWAIRICTGQAGFW